MNNGYNLLKDEKHIKKILEELGYFCMSHEKCAYCPFFDDDCKFETIGKLVPEDYFDFIGDDD